ncbi:DNAj molecular chaperone protein [Trichosporon asahii var. asahii CBS 2479]|uniref:DnaJ homolog 1, mitochondrial n=1 Tax=Trichosporon asahii var. asahii (strain ATCC 90039 / CBS 2479 / JCM 2466 / KCTC 7840 / NBRC 103889/ NCYC 2677 / UAMH 7654) TaxID=1186058 RepID=J4U744_TRIAS|nr:DNAj molecular chaperone protein [Trichosporon asahii var. asahii CBS 2479]EJT46055.1 DNAj molecular chaperone protein [Trichosporon asahii var. asahii CBS 2479]
MPPKLQVNALSRALVRTPLPTPVPQRRQLHLASASSSAGPSGPSSSRPLARRRSEPTLQKRAFHATNVTGASQKDPYDVLGVARDAKTADIKKAYYALAKKWHPDSSKEENAAEKFHEIQSAYDILSDDKKRKAYDMYGTTGDSESDFGPGAGGFGGFQDFGGFGGGRGGQASDLFEQLFGGAFGRGQTGGFSGGGPFAGGAGFRQRPVRGDDLETTVNIDFIQACEGTAKQVTVTPVVECKPCHGSGLKPGEKKATCAQCRGTGQQAFQVQGMFMASTCRACNGSGSTIPRSARCDSCDGVGRVKERTTIDVDIPAGIEDGMKIKVPGAGDAPLSSTGPNGDLFVRVNVKPSSVFRRQGTNIFHDAKVPLTTALLGGKVRIPTLEGDVDVKIREGTQYGQEAVLKGRGVKSLYGRKGERGDLVVTWKVQIPRGLTAKQKKILQEFADDLDGKSAGSTNSNNGNGATGSGRNSADTKTNNRTDRVWDTEDVGRGPQGQGGVADKVAGALGSAVGWAERLLHRNKENSFEDQDKKDGGKK